MKKRRIYINGRFLTGAVTGVERYAREIVTHLDGLLDADPDLRKSYDIVLLMPGVCKDLLPLKHIEQRASGPFNGHLWEQVCLPWLARDGFLINLANGAPLFKMRQLLVIHDAVIYRYPQYFSKAYRLVHMIIDKVCSRLARIATVSDFSKREVSRVLGVAENRITVVPNGYEHILRVEPDNAILREFDLRPGSYFFILGSRAPHKNIDFAVDAFLKVAPPGLKLVVSGGQNSKVFAGAKTVEASNIIYTGRVSDEAIAALYRNAYALIFPSLYEGFGIPPLEALACGTPILVSDVDVLKEVFGASAIYFSPLDRSHLERVLQDVITDRSILMRAYANAPDTLSHFRWSRSASKLLNAVASMM